MEFGKGYIAENPGQQKFSLNSAENPIGLAENLLALPPKSKIVQGDFLQRSDKVQVLLLLLNTLLLCCIPNSSRVGGEVPLGGAAQAMEGIRPIRVIVISNRQCRSVYIRIEVCRVGPTMAVALSY